jgi:hypothetical protein
MSANASLTIVGGPQTIEPGQTTTLTAQIINLGTVPDDFRLSVRQLDPAWVVFRPPTVFLQPGAQATAEIAITPPTSIAPAMLQPIFRLLSRRAGNIAIVEIAMPAPRPMAEPIYEAPVRQAPAPSPQWAASAAPTIVDTKQDWDDEDDEDTGPVAATPVPDETRRLSTSLLVRLLIGLIVVLVLLTIGVFALSRQASAPTLTPTAEANVVAPTAPLATATVPGVTTAIVAITAGPPTATAPTAPRNFIVANTGGQGVYLRRTANIEDRDTAYADDTVLVQIGPDVQAGGITWHNVRTPDGKVGFVPAQFTTIAP